MGCTTALARCPKFAVFPAQHRPPVVRAGLHVAVDQIIDRPGRQFWAGFGGLIGNRIQTPVSD